MSQNSLQGVKHPTIPPGQWYTSTTVTPVAQTRSADPMMNTEEASDFAGIPKRMLLDLVKARRIRCKRVSQKTILIRQSWLESWMAKPS